MWRKAEESKTLEKKGLCPCRRIERSSGKEAGEVAGGGREGNWMLGGDGGAGGKTADRRGLGRSRFGSRIKIRFWVKIRFKVHWI